MARTGRPPTPIEQKRRRGTLRADRTPTNLIPLAPVQRADLGEGPVIQALVDSGAAAWIGRTDLPTVHLAQRLWDDAAALRRALDDQFDPGVFKAYLDATKELRACLSLLGLSPSDRSRLGVAEVKARSKLEELMDRRRTRTASSG